MMYGSHNEKSYNMSVFKILKKAGFQEIDNEEYRRRISSPMELEIIEYWDGAWHRFVRGEKVIEK